MSDETIFVENLHFSYRKPSLNPFSKNIEVLKGISLRINPGEVFVLLGHNGAGKTTLVRVLLGFLPPSSGTVRLLGLSVSRPESRSRVGFLSEQPIFYPHLDAASFLRFYASLADVPEQLVEERVGSLLERTGLVFHGAKPLSSFSKGMLQRLNLCRALVNNPDLVILDEPVIGLDPFGQQLVRDTVLALRREGKTVFINTHATSFAREVADRIGIMMSGSLPVILEKSDILVRKPPFRALLKITSIAGYETFLNRFSLEMMESGVGSVLLPDEAAIDEVLGVCREKGWSLLSLNPLHDPLEERFRQFSAHLSSEEKAQ